jgi:hypothetical protein
MRGAILIALACLASARCSPAPAQEATKPPVAEDTRDVNLRAYVQLLRSDISAQKHAIITDMMQFTEEEDAKFWPIYREYEAELTRINDDRVAGIEEYSAAYGNMTDEIADRLAHTALDLEARRTALKAQYYDRFQAALSAKTAARFLQVENQILLILDLQVASLLPIIQ